LDVILDRPNFSILALTGIGQILATAGVDGAEHVCLHLFTLLADHRHEYAGAGTARLGKLNLDALLVLGALIEVKNGNFSGFAHSVPQRKKPPLRMALIGKKKRGRSPKKAPGTGDPLRSDAAVLDQNQALLLRGEPSL